MAAQSNDRSRLIAAALTGGWRGNPSPLEISETELKSIEPLLLQSGAAGIVWRRAGLSPCKDAPAAASLKQTYRYQTIQAAVREREIGTVFGHLRRAGIEPIIVKGWSVARYYPEKGIRPLGDIDLVVRTNETQSAESALKHPDCDGYHIDLDHQEFSRLNRRNLDAIYARSSLVDLNGESIRVLSAEDHLAFLCLHALRHSGWRPLWFCDIAALVESAGADFDWDLCLGSGNRGSWIACAIGLSHVLLEARIDHTPLARRVARLPKWLAPEVLRQWENSDPMGHAPFNYRRPMASYLRNPSGIAEDLAARWPNAIEATMRVQGPFNDFPRLPFQIGDCGLRTIRFLTGLVRSRVRASSQV